MQQLIEGIKADMTARQVGTTIDEVSQKLFPGRTDLSASEYILIMTRIRRESQYNCDAYISAVKETAKAERSAELCKKLQEVIDRLPAVHPADPVAACAHTVDTPTPAADDVPPTADDAPVPSAVVSPKDLRKEIAKLVAEPGFNEWMNQQQVISSRYCAYLIHKRRFDLANFAIASPSYSIDCIVSANLAYYDDLDGLKWIQENMSTAATLWDHTLIVRYATIRGHLHILKWMVQFDVPMCSDWKEAVDNDHLDIIQWYFITFPAVAKGLAPEIREYAMKTHANAIVDWMITMGV